MRIRKALLVLAALLPVALGAMACSPFRGFEAALVLRDIAAGERPSLYKDVTAEPVRATVSYAVEGRNRHGDLYRPGEGRPAAALVLVPGIAPAGKDDRRLVAFARTLARARFLVLVPEIENLRRSRVSADDAVDIADAVRHLAIYAPREGGRVGTVGLAAISYAAGPALIAALTEAGRKMRFLLAVGGYYDMTALVTYLTTGFYRRASGVPWRQGRGSVRGKWFFLENNADVVAAARDRALLLAIARRRQRDPAADASDLAAGLGPEGRSVLTLLENRDPDRVPGLLAATPERLRRRMEALDPSRRDLSALAPRLILVHGRDDPVIPWTESVALAAAAPPGRADLFLADRLVHVELGPGGLDGALSLWQAVYRLLAERDAMPAPIDVPSTRPLAELDQVGSGTP